MNPTVEAAARKLLSWKRDPVTMSVDEFGYTPDNWQVEALRAFPDQTQQRLALQACVGPGKTFVEAVCGWNFISCYSDGVEFPNGACVSITGENLRANLWKEMAMLRDRSPFLRAAFEMTSERIFERQHPKTWFLEARSFSKSANADAQGRTLSGLHSPYICYFLDEVGDMAPSVLRAAEQGLSNCRWGKIVAAGNASSHLGILYEIVKNQPHLWRIIRVTGDPDDPNRSTRISATWAGQMIEKYGRDNPWVMYAILGLFPPTSVNALLGPDEVAAAMGRHVTQDQYEFVQKRIGIDVARFGDDKTVLFPRQGLASYAPVEMRNARTEAIAGRLIAGKQKWDSEAEFIDDTGGYGAGVIDACRLGGVQLLPINFSSKADDPRYFNKRAEMHWRKAEWVKGGGCLPNIPELAREMCAVTYYYDKGKLRITEKDQIKAELQGHSPDLDDALALTFALVDLPSKTSPEMMLAQFGRSQANSNDFDPWREFGE